MKTKVKNPIYRATALSALVATGLAGCSTADQLSAIGQAPTLSAIENPISQPGYRPVRMPMPAPAYTSQKSNSLWRSGSRAFFKDQRARRVGDILTVEVNITDSAKLENKTERKRTGSEGMNVTSLFGLENSVFSLDKVGGAAKVDLGSTGSSSGEGSVNRKETLTTSIAAVINQVLPNGNLVIEGRQEVRVNFEVRELIVAGIVRPEDITAQNTISSEKIAEARISYGGRGQLTRIQQPRYGQQVLDVLLPF